MKYLVMKNCIVGGAKARAGEVIELAQLDADKLMAIGRVRPHEEPVEEKAPESKIEDRQVKKTTTRSRTRKAAPKKAKD